MLPALLRDTRANTDGMAPRPLPAPLPLPLRGGLCGGECSSADTGSGLSARLSFFGTNAGCCCDELEWWCERGVTDGARATEMEDRRDGDSEYAASCACSSSGDFMASVPRPCELLRDCERGYWLECEDAVCPVCVSVLVGVVLPSLAVLRR